MEKKFNNKDFVENNNQYFVTPLNSREITTTNPLNTISHKSYFTLDENNIITEPNEKQIMNNSQSSLVKQNTTLDFDYKASNLKSENDKKLNFKYQTGYEEFVKENDGFYHLTYKVD